MAHGGAPGEAAPGGPERALSFVPPALLGALVLLLGVVVPPPLAALLHAAARLFGGA